MAQQISDLTINISADSATFTEQVYDAKKKISDMATNAEISAERVRRLNERIAESMSGVAESNSQSMNRLQAQQAQLADNASKKYRETVQAVEDAHQSVSRLSAQIKLTDYFSKQISGIKDLNRESTQLLNITTSIREERKAGNIDKSQYNSLIEQLTAKEHELVQAEKAATAAKEAFLQKLRDQGALFRASASDAAAYRAQQLGISQEAAPLVAAIRDQEIALRRQADQKRAAEIASRGLKAALKEQEVAERAAAQEAQRAESQRASYLQSLREQIELQGKSAAEIHEYRAAQLGVSQQAAPFIAKLKEQDNAWKQGAVSAGQYRMAMRQLPMQITDVVTSLASGMPIWLVTIQQGGQIKDSFGGIGNALKALMSTITPAKVLMGGLAGGAALLATAYYKGSKEQDAFNQSLILTGNTIGKTSGQLADMSKSVANNTKSTVAMSSDVLNQLVSGGKVATASLTSASEAIIKLNDAAGISTKQLVSDFNTIADSPVEAIKKLNEQYHFLDLATYNQIRALQEQGNQQEAARVASDAYSTAIGQRADEIKTKLGILQSAWNGVGDAAKSAWDKMADIGREGSIEEKIKQKQDELNRWTKDTNTRRQLQSELNTLVLQKQMEDDINGARAIGQRNNEKAIKAQEYVNTLTKETLTNAQKRAKEQEKLTKAIADGAKISIEEEARLRKNINDKYKDPKPPKEKQYKTPAGDKAEDSAQSSLLSLQSQLELLKKHTSINDTISQQRQELWKAQAQFTVLEEAATKRQLSTQEKSLLSSKDKVLALAEQKAVLGDQVKYQERLNKLQDASTKYVTQMAEKKRALLDSAGLGDRNAQRRMEEAQLIQGWKNQGGDPDNDVGFKKQLEAVKSLYAEEDRLRGEWQNGVSSAWGNYIDQASDAAGMTKSLFTSAFSGMEDSLTSFATTGKFQFKGFATSVISDLTRIATRLAISSGLQSIFGAIGGSLGGAAAGGSSATGANAFSSGAYNNLSFNAKGGVYSSPGLSAYSGQVVNRPTFFAFAKGAGVMGEAGPEAILPLKRGADGSLGVRAIAAQGGMNLSSAAPQVYITVEANGQATSTAPAGFEQFGSEVGKVVGREYIKLRDKDLRQGGVLRRAIDGR